VHLATVFVGKGDYILIEKNKKKLLELLVKDLIDTIEQFLDKSKDVQNIIALLRQNDLASDLSIAVGLVLFDSKESHKKIRFELDLKDRSFLSKNNILLDID